MQKLKRLPLLRRLGNTVKNLLDSVDKRVARLGSWRHFLVMAAWTLFCLGLLLTLLGCAPQTRIVRPPLPPQAEPRPMPQFTGSTYRDSILWGIEVREWGLSCEADKGVIRRVYGE